MGIEIKQCGEFWKLFIESEEWKFNTRAEMEKCLKILLDLKVKKGQLTKEERK